ncbi:hypothetical protein [Candidatus Azobacteroides pseudotrichonymphae]|uniref:Uncharacterized protein n=1 Tax=Azobacteroides pseudotrichonymphae genomovar. CFP2 TaxID=511995 RepID=B6YS61_AZOPC|nr:hypothetical protein [Candidatus Azobacteroides pseudotrichonymphae]BAG84033.1 hypothetical protein CFPG_P1-12 [Candidatus Azobacteroides pseudotrichonymphae genomovar. CFP2]
MEDKLRIAIDKTGLEQLNSIEDGQEEEEEEEEDDGVFIPKQYKLSPALEQLNALSRSIKRDEKIAPKPEGLQKKWLNFIKDGIHSFVSGLIPGKKKFVPVDIRMLSPYPKSSTVIHNLPNLSINPFSTLSTTRNTIH